MRSGTPLFPSAPALGELAFNQQLVDTAFGDGERLQYTVVG
jgi:hypothetical protein